MLPWQQENDWIDNKVPATLPSWFFSMIPSKFKILLMDIMKY